MRGGAVAGGEAFSGDDEGGCIRAEVEEELGKDAGGVFVSLVLFDGRCCWIFTYYRAKRPWDPFSLSLL